MERGFSAAVKG